MTEEYFLYLKKRSKLGLFYRQYLLYPKLSRLLKGKALDIGCGLGDFVKFRDNTVGVDINSHLVDWCKDLNLNVKLHENDSLPFENKSFDSIILDNVLEHIQSPKKILTEVNRVHVKSGVLIIGVPGKIGYANDPDHKIFYTKEKLINEVCKFGYEIDTVFSTPINIFLLSHFVKQHCVYGVFIKK